MGVYEAIQPEENREFTLGVGNWTGDITWDPGPIGGRSGLIKIDVDPFPAYGVGQLLYPYAKPIRNKYHNFGLYFFAPLGQPGPYIKVTLTDGVYTFDRPWYYLDIYDTWIRVSHDVDIPSDWNIEETIVSFTVKNDALLDPMTTYADGASFYAFTKVDHLPILGVG